MAKAHDHALAGGPRAVYRVVHCQLCPRRRSKVNGAPLEAGHAGDEPGKGHSRISDPTKVVADNVFACDRVLTSWQVMGAAGNGIDPNNLRQVGSPVVPSSTDRG